MEASESEEPEVPAYLLSANQVASEINRKLWTAAEEGDSKAVCAALEEGANINWLNKHAEGKTPLHRASFNKHPECVSALLSASNEEGSKIKSRFIVSINIKDVVNKNTPLHMACSQGNLNIVCMLLEKGADVNITNALGNTPLHAASLRRNAPICRELLNHGANICVTNNRGSSLLQYAIFGLQGSAPSLGDITFIKFLINNGIEVNSRDSIGSTALHSAAQCGLQRICELLLDAGAKIFEDTNGHDPGYYAEIKGFESLRFTLNQPHLIAE